MLQRIKKDVENELSDKIEIMTYCPLTTRRKYLYIALKKKIRIEVLLKATGHMDGHTTDKNFTSNLMNLVMQFRKVRNHPELFERRDIRSPFVMPKLEYTIPRLVEFTKWFPATGINCTTCSAFSKPRTFNKDCSPRRKKSTVFRFYGSWTCHLVKLKSWQFVDCCHFCCMPSRQTFTRSFWVIATSGEMTRTKDFCSSNRPSVRSCTSLTCSRTACFVI